MAGNPACQTFLPQLSPFIDGELPVSERTVVERHLSVCKDCTARVADLRAESGLVRVGMDLLADEVDFKDFANQVMARVTPERLPVWQAWRLQLTELFTYHRGMMVASLAGAAAALVVAVPLLLGDRPAFGYASAHMAVQSVNIAERAHAAPVVMRTESGDSIIWLVDQDEAPAPAPVDPSRSEEMDLDTDAAREQKETPARPQGGEL